MIAIDQWERKDHYRFFKGLDYPHFSITGNLDITAFYPYVKENHRSFFIAVLYAATKTANEIKEFRYRIRGESVVEHETVSPSFTVMGNEHLFGFCTSEYVNDFNKFLYNTSEAMEKTKVEVSLTDEPVRDDLIYMTCIPWIAFTSVTHPIHMTPVDSIPRIAWGQYFREQDRLKMPFSIQAHHALVDGAHVGEYFRLIQEILEKPSGYL